MRRQRHWLDAALPSPTSRRRLEDSPTGDVVRQFGAALDAVGITLQMPSRVIDLTSETELDQFLSQDPLAEEMDGDIDEEEEDEEQAEELRPRESSPTSSVNIEDMIERSVARTISRAYNDMIAHISPPGAAPPPPPPPPQHAQGIVPRTPPARPPPTSPRAPRRAGFVRSTAQNRGVPLDTVLLRVRGRQDPQLVVRLPGGGFSFAPSALYSESRSSLSIPGSRRGRRSRRSLRTSETRRENDSLSNQLQERLHARENERVRRIRRQLRLDEQQMALLEARPRGAAYSPVIVRSNPANSLTQDREFEERLIPSFVATEEMGVPEGKCGICLEEFKAGTLISIIPCQPGGASGTKDHIFCHHCIEQWVRACRGQRTCPLCRGVW